MSKRDKCETGEFLKMVERVIQAAVPRVGNGDGAELAALARLRDQVEWAIADAIAMQLQEGKSWANIGLALGTSRQAAHKRYTR